MEVPQVHPLVDSSSHAMAPSKAGKYPTLANVPLALMLMLLPLFLFLRRGSTAHRGALRHEELCSILVPTDGAVLMWPQHLVHPVFDSPAQASQESTSTVWQVSVCSAAATPGHLEASGSLQVVRLEGCPENSDSPQLAEDTPDHLLASASLIGPDQFYAVLEGPEWHFLWPAHQGNCLYSFPYSVRASGTYRLVLWALRDSWEALTEREYRYGQMTGDK